MDPLTITAAANIGAGLIQGGLGIGQKAKAKRMARANKRPVYEIQQPILDNQEIVESRAGQGITDATRQHLQQDQERGLTSSIDAILAGGGSVNNISDLYSNFSTGISKMALIDEEMRRQNITNLITQNNKLAGEKDKQWQVNVYAPYADKAQAAAALTKQGSDNIWKGVNSVLSAGANWATGNQYANEVANVFPDSGNGGNAVTTNGGAVTNHNPGFDSTSGNVPYSSQPITPAEKLRLTYPGLLIGNLSQ